MSRRLVLSLPLLISGCSVAPPGADQSRCWGGRVSPGQPFSRGGLCERGAERGGGCGLTIHPLG